MSTSPRQRRKQARPQELLAAALELFVAKGFGATKAEEVAARAGVSKGTLYLYYPSKEELFKAVIRESHSDPIAQGADLIARHEGPMAELLVRVMSDWWDQVGKGTAGGITRIMMAEGHNMPELAAFYAAEVIEPTHRLLGGLVERGIASGEFRPVPVAATVHVLISPMLHMMLHEHSFGGCNFHEDPPLDPRAVLETHMNLILRGLLDEAPSKMPEKSKKKASKQ